MKNTKWGYYSYFYDPVNIYDSEFGEFCTIGPFVEIGGAKIGDKCKIGSHSFICPGVTLEDEVFIGHGVMFCNDNWPRSTKRDGSLKGKDDWELKETLVKKRASIGSGAIILAGVTIGENAMVAAGAVVICNVMADSVYAGNPAEFKRSIKEKEDD